jgi:hypothetical protein
LALAFRAPDEVEPALDRAWGALRPGGCALVASLDAHGADLGLAVSRPCCALRGGARSPTSRPARCSAAPA